jgi:hypothetical protein
MILPSLPTVMLLSPPSVVFGQKLIRIFDDERASIVQSLARARLVRAVDQRLPIEVGAVRAKVGGDPFQAEGVRLALDQRVLCGAGRAEVLVAVVVDGFSRGLLEDIQVPALGMASARVAHGEFQRHAVGGTPAVRGVGRTGTGAVRHLVAIPDAVAVQVERVFVCVSHLSKSSTFAGFCSHRYCSKFF